MSEYQSVDTDHIKDITCKDVDDGKEYLMKDVNLEHMSHLLLRMDLILLLLSQVWKWQVTFSNLGCLFYYSVTPYGYKNHKQFVSRGQDIQWISRTGSR